MKSSRRAWLVFAGCILLQAALVGVLINCASVLIAGVLDDTGFSAGDLSVYYTIREVTYALTVGFTVPMVMGRRSSPALVLMGGFAGVNFILMAFYSRVWQFWFSALLAGIGSSCVLTLVPIVINNWFREHQGLLLGLTSSASGLTGAVFSPVVSALVNAKGWRFTAVALGLFTILLTVGAALLIVIDPAKCGLEPYGRKTEISENTSGPREAKAPGRGFGAALAIILLLGMVSSFATHLTVFAESLGYTLTAAALCASSSMVGNICGKLSLGALADRLGIYRAVILNASAVALSFVLFLIFPQVPFMVMAAGFFLGLVHAGITVTPSRVLLDLYGRGGYEKLLSRSGALNYLALSATTLLFPYVYDWTGSFTPALIFCLVCLAAVILLTLRLAASRDRWMKESAE